MGLIQKENYMKVKSYKTSYILDNIESSVDEFINYNLEYAMDYSYLDLAFELIHRLLNFYVENNKIENIQLLISQYYDLYQKSSSDKNTLIYYNDMA